MSADLLEKPRERFSFRKSLKDSMRLVRSRSFTGISNQTTSTWCTKTSLLSCQRLDASSCGTTSTPTKWRLGLQTSVKEGRSRIQMSLQRTEAVSEPELLRLSNRTRTLMRIWMCTVLGVSITSFLQGSSWLSQRLNTIQSCHKM